MPAAHEALKSSLSRPEARAGRALQPLPRTRSNHGSRNRLGAPAGARPRPRGFTVNPKLVKLLQHASERFNAGGFDYGPGRVTHISRASTVEEDPDPPHRPGRRRRKRLRAASYPPRHASRAPERADQSSSGSVRLDQRQLPLFGAQHSPSSTHYSVNRARALRALESARLGDFVDGAQIIIERFCISASPSVAADLRALTLLLAHGSGRRPEHSSARLKRFLQLAGAGEHPVRQHRPLPRRISPSPPASSARPEAPSR